MTTLKGFVEKEIDLFIKLNADISEKDMNEFFDTIVEIGKRIDIELNKKGQSRYVKTIKRYRSSSMEPETNDK